MRKLAFCVAGLISAGALAMVSIAQSPASTDPSVADALGSAVRLAGIEKVQVRPRHAVIQIDEVLVIGEIKPKRSFKLPSLAPVDHDPDDHAPQVLSRTEK